MKSEQEVQNEIRVALPKGHADLYGFRPDGQIFYVEVKKENGRVRPEQENFIETVKKRGAIAGIARSAEEALELVK